MNRRAFISSLIGTAGAFALDPERLLWVPGRKLISIPATTANLARSWDIHTLTIDFGIVLKADESPEALLRRVLQWDAPLSDGKMILWARE